MSLFFSIFFPPSAGNKASGLIATDTIRATQEKAPNAAAIVTGILNRWRRWRGKKGIRRTEKEEIGTYIVSERWRREEEIGTYIVSERWRREEEDGHRNGKRGHGPKPNIVSNIVIIHYSDISLLTRMR